MIPKSDVSFILFFVFETAIEPAFTMPLQNLTIMEGRNATFTCHVRQISDYKVSKVKCFDVSAPGYISKWHHSHMKSLYGKNIADEK